MSIMSKFTFEKNRLVQDSLRRKRDFFDWYKSDLALTTQDNIERKLELVFEVGERPDEEPILEARYVLGEPMTFADMASFVESVFRRLALLNERQFREAIGELASRRYDRLFDSAERMSLCIKPVCIRANFDNGGLLVGYEGATYWLGEDAVWFGADVISSTECRFSGRVLPPFGFEDDERRFWRNSSVSLVKEPANDQGAPVASEGESADDDDRWIFPFDIVRE